jgi:hypothetical protein
MSLGQVLTTAMDGLKVAQSGMALIAANVANSRFVGLAIGNLCKLHRRGAEPGLESVGLFGPDRRPQRGDRPRRAAPLGLFCENDTAANTATFSTELRNACSLARMPYEMLSEGSSGRWRCH